MCVCLYATLIIRIWYLSRFCSNNAIYDLKGIESDSHSSILIMFVLVIINAMMNLKQFGPLVLICVETNWPGSSFAMAVLGCRSLVLVIIIISIWIIIGACNTSYVVP